MADSSKVISMQDLAQSVSEGVLRAIAANKDFKAFLAPNGPGLVVRPHVTAGGIYYFGAAAKFANASMESFSGGAGRE
jgi:hypothetical protein